MGVRFQRILGICISCFIFINLAQCSIKKGLCVGPERFLCDDFKVWHNINWWYDWNQNLWWIKMNSNCTTFAPNWVAMVHGWDPNDHPVNIPKDSKYILGFNEPNAHSGADLTPQQAATHWREIERASRGLPLVSPVAASCKTSSPNCRMLAVDWYDEFFKHCNGCRVDYLAAHAYWCTANQTMSYIENLWHRYGKKIWLTEFACPLTDSVDTQLKFMKDILPRLESADYVYRYSWFNSRVLKDVYVKPSASLLEMNSSTLTRLGRYYNNFRWGFGHHHNPAVVG